MSGFGAPADGSPRLVLGLAIVLVAHFPIWALLLWVATSSLPWRWRAEMSWKRVCVPMAALAAVIGGGYGLGWAGNLFSRSRLTERNVVYWVWTVLLFLAGIALLVVAWARDAGVGTAASHQKRRRGRAVVLAWGALALVLAALRVGPLGGKPTPSVDWVAFAASSGVLVMLMVLLIIAIIELRNGGAGNVADGSGRRGLRCVTGRRLRVERPIRQNLEAIQRKVA